MIYKFPGAEQLLDRITQVEQFTQEEREQFLLEFIRKAEDNANEQLQSSLASLRTNKFQNKKSIYEILMSFNEQSQLELVVNLLNKQ